MVCFPAGVLDIYFRGNLLAVLLLVVVRVLACPSAHQHTRVVYARSAPRRHRAVALRRPRHGPGQKIFTPMTRILGEFEPNLH